MGEIDSIHGGAVADSFIEENNFLIRVLRSQAGYQVQFGTNCPF
ncbi:MAG: hypothetical protein RL560_280, partial [Actinomycetota bacterium]